MQKRKDTLLHSLLTGKLRIKVGSHYYYLTHPDQDIRILALIEQENCLHKLRFEPWLNEQSMEALLINRGIITSGTEQQLSSLSKRLEDLKVDLYNSKFKTANELKIRKELGLVREKMVEVERKRNSLYYMTIEGYAARQKLMIILGGTLRCEISGRLVYPNLGDLDYTFLDNVAHQKSLNEPTDSEIREIARTNPWRSLWSFGKPNPLNKDILDLGEYQQALYMYSHLYDNIRESMDCPTDSIINDDDLCDGWLIIQSRKADKEKEERQNEQVVGPAKAKNSNAAEVFIPVSTPEQVQAVQSMNSVGSKIVLAQRKKVIETRGEAHDIDFMDTKLKVQQQLINNQKKVSGKK
jgi:hypothetical protein